jgi:hypothetical protein
MSKKQQAAEVANDQLTPLQQQLLDRADSIMDSIATTVDKASTFAAEQVPDIALQYVAFGRASITAYMTISVIVFCVAFWMAVRIGVMNSRQYPVDTYGTWDERRVGAFVVGGLMGIGSIIAFFVNLNHFIMVWVAPKIWLINEIARLVKR